MFSFKKPTVSFLDCFVMFGASRAERDVRLTLKKFKFFNYPHGTITLKIDGKLLSFHSPELQKKKILFT